MSPMIQIPQIVFYHITYFQFCLEVLKSILISNVGAKLQKLSKINHQTTFSQNNIFIITIKYKPFCSGQGLNSTNTLFNFSIVLQAIYNMSSKKSSKKEEERLMEVQRQREEEKKEAEKRQKEERLQQLAKKSTPLVDYGLLDAYEFFLAQLAAAGLPQGNIYEFAAQTMLKFEKNKVKKNEKLKEVERANEEAAKLVAENNRSRSRPRVPRQIKPQLLPFKGDLSPQQKQMMGMK